MKVINFVLSVVLLMFGFYTEAMASETSDRISDKNFQRNLNRTEGEYRAAEGSYNSIKERLDKIDGQIAAENKIIEDAKSIINQIEMGVFRCDEKDRREYYENHGNGYFDCSRYVLIREKRNLSSSQERLSKLEWQKKTLQDQLSGAKSNLDEKRDEYTVAKENYDAFNKFKENQQRAMDEHNTVIEKLDTEKRDVIQGNKQIVRDNAEFLNEKPQYKSPRTWRPKD